MLRWLDVDSSMLRKVAVADPTTPATDLYAQFSDGAVYRYDDVDILEVVEFLFDEDSQGKAFNRLIKRGGYVYERLDPDEAAQLLGA